MIHCQRPWLQWQPKSASSANEFSNSKVRKFGNRCPRHCRESWKTWTTRSNRKSRPAPQLAFRQAAEVRGRAAGGFEKLRLVFGFVVGDELGDFGVRSDWLDQNDVVRVEEHAIRTVHLIAAPHQNV